MSDVVEKIYSYAFYSRGKSGVHRNLVVALKIHWIQFTTKSEFQIMTTEHGWSLTFGFKTIW